VEIKRETALFQTLDRGNGAVADLLLAHSARWDFVTVDGRTILDVVAEKDHPPMVDVFMRHLGEKRLSEAANAVSFDTIIKWKDFVSALHQLSCAAIPPGRAAKTAKINSIGYEPIVGAGCDYLLTLCRSLASLTESFPPHSGYRAKESWQIPMYNQHRGSEDTFRINLDQMLTCLTSHADCINAEGPLPLLPTRVVDVGPVDGSEEPVLRELPGVRGRYVALSHPWGNISMAKLDKSNLKDRLKCIPFDSLTKVMQEAVVVTRKFGVRFLWIDALCIIQDSHGDWSKEACNMANIYRNCLFSIAAGVSADHSDGFFSDPISMTSKASDCDTLDSRGWILQELLLAPRILRYSRQGVFWECISSEFPHSWSNATFKRALFGLRSTSWSLKMQAHMSWLNIVTDYSKREFTKEKDKLMAIVGIAQYIASSTKDRFLAGLWERDIWYELLWSTPSGNASRLKSMILPSWSWASVSGVVSYRWPSGSSSVFLMPEMVLKSAIVDADLSSSVVNGCLIIEGRLRQFLLRNDDKVYPTCLPDKTYIPKNRSVSSTDSKLKDSDWVGLFWPDTEEEKPANVTLLFIASQMYWEHCLVLVPVDDTISRNAVGLTRGQYRRIGVSHLDTLRCDGFSATETRTISLV
jgi:hypothetical protein